MILEIDCGNTWIKWRLHGTADASLGAQQKAADVPDLLEQLKAQRSVPPTMIRLVSVRQETETIALIAALERRYAVPLLLAQSAPLLCGVRNGYQQPHLLGTDRWLALVAAFIELQAPCVVISLGTAVTVDYVDASGVHLGGFITPGRMLMQQQLCAHTAGIRFTAEHLPIIQEPGSSTAQAVERGTQLMLLSFTQAQQRLAQERLGYACRMVLTGGDAPLVVPYLPDACWVEDLVFRGLALACPA